MARRDTAGLGMLRRARVRPGWAGQAGPRSGVVWLAAMRLGWVRHGWALAWLGVVFLAAPTDAVAPQLPAAIPESAWHTVIVEPLPEGTVMPRVDAAPGAQPIVVTINVQSVTGSATWYCKPNISACPVVHSGGMYAAAGSELRIGNWRGRYVNVTYQGRTIRVQLVDWCACGGDRAIDLFADAFAKLAPLNAGVLRGVSINW